MATSKATKKKGPAADRSADETSPDPTATVSSYDHESQTLTEPEVGTDGRAYRHQVDPVMDIELEEGADPNGPIPRRGDPYAHQRDKEAAEAAADEEVERSEKTAEERAEYEREKREDERQLRDQRRFDNDNDDDKDNR